MKEEEDNSTETSMCLASTTQAIELEFIKTYEQLPILWDIKHPDYTNKYRRCVAIDKLLKIMKKWDSAATRLTVRYKINVLRSSYRKDLRKHLASKTIGPDGQERYGYNPKNWKFHALKFLGGKLNEDVEHFKNNSIAEINLDNINFEEEASEEISDDELSSHTSDVLRTISEDKSQKPSYTHAERRKKKRIKREVPDNCVDDNTFDREFEAIGANVACKLKRMNVEQRCHADTSEVPDNCVEDNTFDREFDAIGANVACKLKRMNVEQRFHAELLIHKVLIEGLKNKLTEDTDLTEVYK